MKTSFISTLTAQSAMRLTIQRSQVEIQNLQKEVVTGRYADIGESLGSGASRSVTLNRDVLRLETMKDSNSLVTQRLSASQLALEEMSNQAQELLEAFISVNSSNDATRLSVADQTITNALSSFTSAANTSSNGEFLMGGINTDTKPLTDYQEAGNPAKATFDAAFFGYFGFTQDDPAAAGISVTAMDDFLTNTLEPLFSGPQWNADWSTASDSNVTSRISSKRIFHLSLRRQELLILLRLLLVQGSLVNNLHLHGPSTAMDLLELSIRYCLNSNAILSLFKCLPHLCTRTLRVWALCNPFGQQDKVGCFLGEVLQERL